MMFKNNLKYHKNKIKYLKYLQRIKVVITFVSSKQQKNSSLKLVYTL